MPLYRFGVIQEFEVVYEVEADSMEEAEDELFSGFGQSDTLEQWPGDIVDIFEREEIE